MAKRTWLRHTFGIVLLASILRKVLIGHEAMKTVNECKSQVSAINMVYIFYMYNYNY